MIAGEPHEQRRMMSALVTGATTPLGRALCSGLRAHGVALLATGIEAPPAALMPPGVDYLRADLARPRELHDLIFGAAVERKVDTIFHLAAHRRAGDEGRSVHRINVESVRHLLEHTREHPTIRRLVLRSSADVYLVEPDLPAVVTEDHPLNHTAGASQWLRDRVEADTLACARMGMGTLEIVLLRLAEVFAPEMGSQIYDYVSSRLCLRPLGFNPMINLLSVEDAAQAFILAGGARDCQGVFNIPGADTLPLRACIRALQRMDVPLPGPLLGPLYRWRRRAREGEFSYELYRERMHLSALLDGRRAARAFGYAPRHHALSLPVSSHAEASEAWP